MKIQWFKKRAIWLPTWPVGLAIVAVTLLLAIWLFSGLHRFLAITKPAPGAEVLVVEAWVTDAHTEQIAAMLQAEGSPYRELWLTGPVLTRGSLIAAEDRDTYAELTAAGLLALGVPESKVHIAPAADSQRHRTWNAAKKLGEAFETRDGGVPDRFDLVTVATHARRSRLAFRRAFDSEIEIGVIALDPVTYDQARWYKSSAGMKGTLLEFVAYLYERVGSSGR